MKELNPKNRKNKTFLLIGEVLREIKKDLAPIAKDLAQHDSERIMESVLELTRSDLYVQAQKKISESQYGQIKNLVNKRLTGIPLQYVLGKAYFYAKEFLVTPDVLIPRQETELLIDLICRNESSDPTLFLDLGTGSGNIAESLLHERPNWQALAVDIAPLALKVARKNCCSRAHLICGDRLCAIKKKAFFDFIVSNPPYISQTEMDLLDKSVIDYEPQKALYGGKNGFDFYLYLAANSRSILKKPGHIYCEIGASQSSSVREIFSSYKWQDITIYNDLAGKPRIMKACAYQPAQG